MVVVCVKCKIEQPFDGSFFGIPAGEVFHLGIIAQSIPR